MALWATFLAGADVVMHAAGWLESGLVACFEKYLVDVELLGMLRAQFTPFPLDEAALAFDAHVEVGHSGHFLGAAHTLARYRDCFRLPILASTDSYERWTRTGAADTTARAAAGWRAALDRYTPPPLDDGVRAALDEHVVRRRQELGD